MDIGIQPVDRAAELLLLAAVDLVNNWKHRKGKSPLIAVVKCRFCEKLFPISTQDMALGKKRDFVWTCNSEECSKEKAEGKKMFMRQARLLAKEMMKPRVDKSGLPDENGLQSM